MQVLTTITAMLQQHKINDAEQMLVSIRCAVSLQQTYRYPQR